jgi:hypothetical protein
MGPSDQLMTNSGGWHSFLARRRSQAKRPRRISPGLASTSIQKRAIGFEPTTSSLGNTHVPQPVKVPERPECSDFVLVPVFTAVTRPALEFLGHLPHGPPETLRILAAIILLN